MICMKYLNLIFVFLVLVGCSNKGEKQANALLSKSFFLEKSINEINTSHVQNAFSKYQDNIELVIVDGASEDDTYDVIAAAQMQISNIQYFILLIYIQQKIQT